MATIRIMYWKDIPYALRAFDDDGRCSKQLPKIFETTVDSAAMAAGMAGEDDYQSGFRWGDKEERPGTAEENITKLYTEIVAAYPPHKLASMVRTQRND